MTEPVRLSKRVIDLIHCSRSEADRYIADGWVRVNGVVVEEPQFKVEDELVEVDPAAKDAAPAEPATLLFHAPAGYDPAADTHALADPENRWAQDPSGIQPLKRHRVRLVTVLALDPAASGLCVLTQDPQLLKRVREEGDRIEQELLVEVQGTLAPGGLERMARGQSFQGRALAPAKVSWQNETKLRFALRAPLPGQIAHVCKSVGLEVVSAKRLRIGSIPLSKLPLGQWRYLPPREKF